MNADITAAEQSPHNKDAAVLAGQTALISGGARRLGAALTLALARAGVATVVHYNASKEDALRTVEAARAMGVRAWALQGDLSNHAIAASLVEEAIQIAGPIDYLINNASIFDETTFADTTPDAVHENVAINAVAPMLLARSFAAQERQGAVLNMLDTMIMDYDKRHVPYHLSKRMLQALTRIMALEFAPRIRVNAVAPGLILPPAGYDNAYLEQLAHTNPLQRYGSPADITDAALFLLRAEFICGQTLYVDGGRHLKGSMYE